MSRTIIVSIIDFNLFECMEFHSFFQPLEVMRHTLLSDKMGFHFFELKKLPDNVSEKDSLLLWLSLFKAETEEDLEKIKGMGVPTMEQVVNAYYAITASPEFREMERLREKARHDKAQALQHAEQKEIQKGIAKRNIEVARKMLVIGIKGTMLMGVTFQLVRCIPLSHGCTDSLEHIPCGLICDSNLARRCTAEIPRLS